MRVRTVWRRLVSYFGKERMRVDLIGYGDSLTQGTGSDTNYVALLAEELGLPRYANFGYGGCNSRFIAWAVGGIVGYLEPSKAVDAQILDESLTEAIGDSVNLNLNGKTVWINGKRYRVRQTQRGRYTIQRYMPPDAYTPVELSDARISALLYCIWIGTNDHQLKMEYIDAIIEKLQTDRYVVMGLTRLGIDTTTEQEAEALERYGEHWFNVRREIVEHSFETLGLTPTAEDTAAMTQGLIPPSLLHDSVHLNRNGYRCIAKLLAQKIRDNGYV